MSDFLKLLMKQKEVNPQVEQAWKNEFEKKFKDIDPIFHDLFESMYGKPDVIHQFTKDSFETLKNMKGDGRDVHIMAITFFITKDQKYIDILKEISEQEEYGYDIDNILMKDAATESMKDIKHQFPQWLK